MRRVATACLIAAACQAGVAPQADTPTTLRVEAVDERARLRDQGGDILILARTDARHEHGLDEAIARAAEFARLGGLHRNTFINSPLVLDRQLRLKNAGHIRFAGQITGCEGYVESAAMGLLTGLFAAAERHRRSPLPPPATTAMGARRRGVR